MPNENPKVTATAAEETAMEAVNLDSLVGDNDGPIDLSALESVDEAALQDGETMPVLPGAEKKELLVVTEKLEKNAPDMSSAGWQDFVMGQFARDEMDDKGNPFVAGLRRVARKLLGPILDSSAHVVQAPTVLTGFESTNLLQPATVEYSITFLWCKFDHDEQVPYNVRFTDVADAYYGNTAPEYARYPSSMAATRAEARCLRKALQLKKVVGAEETTTVDVEDSGVSGLIGMSQINFINVLCQRIDVDVVKYINSGTTKYSSIEEVPYLVAQKMVEHLSSLQNNLNKIKPEIKGYSKDWRKK